MYRESLKWCVLDEPIPDEYIFKKVDIGQSDEQFIKDLDDYGLTLVDDRLLERREEVKNIVAKGETVKIQGLENAVSLPVPVAIKTQDGTDTIVKSSHDSQIESPIELSEMSGNQQEEKLCASRQISEI